MTALSFSIAAAAAFAPGLETENAWKVWAESGSLLPSDAALPKTRRIPMMAARRLSPGIRLAAESALSLLETAAADALVFCSRHAEVARNEKLLLALSRSEELSPTDFMMSVHNAAAGAVSIQKKIMAPAVSIAAGADTFHAGFTESIARLKTGAERVLFCAFESELPPLLGSRFPAGTADAAFGMALLLENGTEWSAEFLHHGEEEPPEYAAVQFLRGLYGGKPAFRTQGGRTDVIWRRCSNE